MNVEVRRHLVTMVLCAWTAAAWAGPAADKCESGKNKEAGTYALCLQKAEAKYALTADGAARRRARPEFAGETLSTGGREYPKPGWQNCTPVSTPRRIAPIGICKSKKDEVQLQLIQLVFPQQDSMYAL
jgi:hypothetical protein